MSRHRDNSDDEDDTFVTVGTPLPTYEAGQLSLPYDGVGVSWRLTGQWRTDLQRWMLQDWTFKDGFLELDSERLE